MPTGNTLIDCYPPDYSDWDDSHKIDWDELWDELYHQEVEASIGEEKEEREDD